MSEAVVLYLLHYDAYNLRHISQIVICVIE